MPLVGDDRHRDRESALNALALLDLEEVQAARRLPAIVVGLLLGIPIFVVVAIALAFVLVGLYQIVGTTSPIASGLGLAWFGGSLVLTAVAVRPLLRRINTFLRTRGLPTLY